MAENQQENKSKNKQDEDLNPFGKKPSTPKFNPYWIYGIAIVLFLAFQVFDWDSKPEEIYWQKFKNTMLDSNDVEKIEIVNGNRADIYIKKSKLDMDKYR